MYREPRRSDADIYGWKYGSVCALKSGASVSPLAAPTSRVGVANLLP